MMNPMNRSFTTGNSVVRTLPIGSLLEVSALGELTVVDLPTPVVTKGSRISTKYGPATVVGVTGRDQLNEAFEQYDVVYIADGTDTVRVASFEDVSNL